MGTEKKIDLVICYSIENGSNCAFNLIARMSPYECDAFHFYSSDLTFRAQSIAVIPASYSPLNPDSILTYIHLYVFVPVKNMLQEKQGTTHILLAFVVVVFLFFVYFSFFNCLLNSFSFLPKYHDAFVYMFIWLYIYRYDSR